MKSRRRRIKTSNPPNLYQFPYVKFHGKFYPLIPLTISREGNTVNTFALIDSGASMSVFRPEIAEALKIPKKRKFGVRLGTASGGVDIAVSKVRLSVGKTMFDTKIGFSREYAASFNIIGREGFFHRFSICFNEISKTVLMVPLEDLPR
ncbi:MAG: aspartyl protease family protein [Elusimicrobia bacterium]|nr:aspartyl protease family protein [Elusimicrobiota bacterium]